MHRKNWLWALAPLLALIVLISGAGFASAAGRPSHISGGEHSCSYTNPEYMASDENASVTLTPGTMKFTAEHTTGHRLWEDTYWVTGFHNENSHICDSRELPGSGGKHGKSFTMPLRKGSLPLVTADLSDWTSSNFSGRLGFDLWFAADTSETGPSSMMADSRTWEIMVVPGTGGWRVVRDSPGWHRVYITALHPQKTAHALDLTSLVDLARVPAGMWWMSVDQGGEFTKGSFGVSSYSLHMSSQKPKAAGTPVKKSGAKAKPRPPLPLVKVPDVRNKHLAAAVHILRKHGFRVRAPHMKKGKALFVRHESGTGRRWHKHSVITLSARGRKHHSKGHR